jgi:anti-sigma regulatory factor (Ser/Thr protein kinase)
VQTSGPATDAQPRFLHSALLYDTDAAYGATLAAFVREGLARDEAVAVAANARHTTLLRDHLDGDAGEVRFLPAEEWYVRPVRTIAGWAQLLRAASASGRPAMRLIGHTSPAHGTPTWVRFESALNTSLAGLRGHLLCPYDRTALPADAVRSAARTHPRLYDGGWRDSAGYEPPERLLTEVPEPPYPVIGVPVIAVPVKDTVSDLRAQVRARATAEGWLSPERVENLLLAVSEVATNGIRHGGEQRELRVWLTDDAVVCEVTDNGAVPPGPLAGYLPPRGGVIGGMGLWLVQQLCDALAIRTVDGRTHARFAMRRDPA